MSSLGQVPGFDQALAYVRGKVDAFNRLGRVELPALRRQITAVWIAARDAGESDLAQRAQADFDALTQLQADWELHNDTLQSVLAPLRTIGVNLGALPAWAIAAVIGLAAGIAAMFLLRDDIEDSIIGIYEEAVRRGIMTPAAAAEQLREFREESEGLSWPAALITLAVVGAAVYFLPRPSRGQRAAA